MTKIPWTVIGIVALVFPLNAQRRPLDLRTDTDYPLQGDPVTLSANWEGLTPQYRGRYQLRYQASRTNPPTWLDVPTSACTVQPCMFRLASPAVAEFRGQAQYAILVRAVIRDLTTGTETPANAVKTVTWIIDPNRQAPGGYSLTLQVNGQPGCTIKPRPNDTSYANANCRNRGPLDVHDPRVPWVGIRPDSRGRFISDAFTITATWGGLPPPGVWYATINHGNFSKRCKQAETTCVLQIPQQDLQSEFIGRANTTAAVAWVENTRDNPTVHGWPSSLGAEVGIDFIKK